MTDADDHIPSTLTDVEETISSVVETVRELGERARLLSVNLAVAAARLQQTQRGHRRFNDDLLDLVSRITRVTQSVNEAIASMEKGGPQVKGTSRELNRPWREVGVPDMETLDRLAQSLSDTMAMASIVFRYLRQMEEAENPSNPQQRVQKRDPADEAPF